MHQEKTSSSLNREVQFLRESGFDSSLLEVFIGEREATRDEKNRLEALSAKLKERIYPEIVYLLTHIDIEKPDEAKKIFEDIIKHRNDLVRVLKRYVSIEVAALDYLQNIRNILKKPTIIEADQYTDCVYHAVIDETTKAFDKHILDTDIDAEIERTHRFQTCFSLLFIDLDDLKKINDSYGHEAGTEAIKHISEIIRCNLRKYDSIYRYGGDEFVVLLPNADSMQACDIALRMLENAKNSTTSNLPFVPGISIGIATYDKDCSLNRESLLDSADKALYAAKHSGKNAICLHRNNSTPLCVTAGIAGRLINDVTGSRKIIKGSPITNGIGIGRIFLYHDILSREMQTRELADNEIPAEIERIKLSIEYVKTNIEKNRKSIEKIIGPCKASIFDVHKTILNDTCLLDRIECELRKSRINGENIIRTVFRQLELQFRNTGSTMLVERTHDLFDICRNILRAMTGIDANILADIPSDSVIFARRLLPSDTVHFTNQKPCAIVTEEGGSHSHASIIARSMEIPCISDILFSPADIPQGTQAIVDADNGELIINPDEEDIKAARNKLRCGKVKCSSRNAIMDLSKKHNYPAKQEHIKVFANVSIAEDIKAAVRLQCDGIGLYRTENIYLLSREMPEEEILYRTLHESLKPAINLPVVLRLVDLGADKTLPYLNAGKEHSSLLGLRGVRFLLKYRELLLTQLRVFMRLLKDYNIRILVPFVTTKQDMLQIRESVNNILDQSAELKNSHNKIKLGAMIETPLSAFNIDSILDTCDFVSIGTNDLQQFVTAADRESLLVSKYYNEGTENVVAIVADVLASCKRRNMDCYVCGQIAGRVEYVKPLLDTGLTLFSVLPPLIPSTRENIALYLSEDKPDDTCKGRGI